MKDTIIMIPVIDGAVTGACGAMAILGHPSSAPGGASAIVGPTGARDHLASSSNDHLQIAGKLCPALLVVGLYAQADDGENENGDEEKKEEEAPPLTSVDRVWDIVMSA